MMPGLTWDRAFGTEETGTKLGTIQIDCMT